MGSSKVNSQPVKCTLTAIAHGMTHVIADGNGVSANDCKEYEVSACLLTQRSNMPG